MGFQLNIEQVELVKDCLRRSNLKLSAEAFGGFTQGIEASISHFRARPPDQTIGQAREELREVYLMADSADPPIGQIRAKVSKLSDRAIKPLEACAQVVQPELWREYPYDREFRSWLSALPQDILVDVIRRLFSTGGQIVAGRTRPGGKRSGARYEPRILGSVKGAGQSTAGLGRPQKHAEFDLVMHLADVWHRSTGQFPPLQRTDKTGFGNLVHHVFQWCDLSYDAANYSLRRSAEEMKNSGKPMIGKP